MSNVGRPREGMKPCAKCGSKDRDSNGQCRCRNTLYRLTKGLNKGQRAQAVEAFDGALPGKGGKGLDKAVAAVRAIFPAPERKNAAKKAPAKKAPAKKAPAKKAPAKKVEPAVKTPDRYILVVDDFEETPYARKDAAVKNGLRSGKAWTVTFKGKTVAQSDDLL